MPLSWKFRQRSNNSEKNFCSKEFAVCILRFRKNTKRRSCSDVDNNKKPRGSDLINFDFVYQSIETYRGTSGGRKFTINEIDDFSRHTIVNTICNWNQNYCVGYCIPDIVATNALSILFRSRFSKAFALHEWK